MEKLITSIVNKFNLKIEPINKVNLTLVKDLSELKINEKYLIGVFMINIGTGENKNTYIDWKNIIFKQHHELNKHIYKSHIKFKLIYKYD